MTGRIFNIQRFSVQDGPGIRTTVFLKGCPLACPWCANPESRHGFPEVGHVNALCNGCGRCVEVCPLGAIAAEEKHVAIDRTICDNCGLCVDVCAPAALKMFGSDVTVDEVFAEIKKDELYYQNSNGGVTASGGEPLAQSEFVAALFARCREAGIHTALDTCGCAAWSALERVLEHTDLVLFDLKLIDDARHRAIAKATNEPILRNARRLAESDVPLVIRLPLIPGYTEERGNLRDLAGFVAELGGGIEAVNILPYHRFGSSKYEMLDLAYEPGESKPPSEERITQIVASFEALGLPCEVVV